MRKIHRKYYFQQYFTQILRLTDLDLTDTFYCETFIRVKLNLESPLEEFKPILSHLVKI